MKRLKMTNAAVVRYLEEHFETNPASYDDNGNMQYYILIDENGNLTHGDDFEFEAYVAPSLEDLGYPYYKQFAACEKHNRVPDFEIRFGHPIYWLEEQENNLSPKYISEVIEPLAYQVNKIWEKLEKEEKENDDDDE